LRRTWGEAASITLAAYFSHATVEDWNGKKFEYEDETLVSGPTLLTKDSPSLVGLDGGWGNSLSLALAYDTRDFEPDPKSGWMAEYVLEAATSVVGSDYDYFRQTVLLTGAYTLLGWWTVAGRLAVTDVTGDSPFYEKGVFNQSTNRSEGVGGARTGRGFPLRRFVADTMAVAQWDNRFFLGDTMILGQRFGLQVLGFVDMGNVYDEFNHLFTKPRWHHLKVSYGGGVIIPWNLATLIHVVAGWSAEGMSISIDFGHAF
jgi:outer membrane protein assembly factor BamA